MKYFTFFGFAAIGVLLLLWATGKYSSAVVMFLAVLLLSMVLINWGKLGPLFIKEVPIG